MSYLRFHTLYPVDLERQQIIDIEFHPEGGQFIYDNRGQPIVYYYFADVPPGTEHETWWRARVRTWKMQYDIAPEDVGALDDIPAEITTEYLADDPLFQITSPVITGARDDALQGEAHPLFMAQAIFAWIQAHLYYESAGGWDDAVTVIQRGNGSCSEYAFAFIAVCRSAGIPARWTGSLVRRGAAAGPGPYRDDPHHRWAEVYLPNIGWVHCNVQGGTWGYLAERYIVTSQSSGPSAYLSLRYDSYRRWSYGGGSGSTARERYGLWYSDVDDFYMLNSLDGTQVWDPHEDATVLWSILGNTEPDALLTMELSRLGEPVWVADGLDPQQGTIDIPLSSLSQTGPHFDLRLFRTDKPDLSGSLFPIEIRDDTDSDGLDDGWEYSNWRNLAQTASGDPDGDLAGNRSEYYGMTDPTLPDRFASDLAELGGEVGLGTIGHNEYGCGLTGKIEVNGIAWDKSLGVHADSWVEYEVPGGINTFRGMYGLEDHNAGSVVFECHINGAVMFTSARIAKPYGFSAYPAFVELPVEPGDHVTLTANALFDNYGDYSCWLQPAWVRTGPAYGDLDADNDVDLADFASFQNCFTGLGEPTLSDPCRPADFDGKNGVDLADISKFTGAFEGP